MQASMLLHSEAQSALAVQAWEFVQETVQGLTERIAAVCLDSADGRFRTHAVRLMETLLTSVEADFHGEPKAPCRL